MKDREQEKNGSDEEDRGTVDGRPVGRANDGREVIGVEKQAVEREEGGQSSKDATAIPELRSSSLGPGTSSQTPLSNSCLTAGHSTLPRGSAHAHRTPCLTPGRARRRPRKGSVEGS